MKRHRNRISGKEISINTAAISLKISLINEHTNGIEK